MGIVVNNLTYGPGSIVTDGLILYYDPENTVTYTPTLNKNFHPNPTDIFAWSGTNSSNCTLSRDTISSPVGNKPLKMVVSGNDPFTFTYNTSSWNLSPAVIGQTWTVSVWAKASVATTGQIFIFEANSSSSYIQAPATNINITTEWQRFSYTYTFIDPNSRFIQTRLDGPNTGGSGVTIWWDGLQVEFSNEVTGFTTTSAVTNSTIVDLSSSSKQGTLNGPLFNGTSFDFDGISDVLSFSSFGTSISNNFSYEFWCMPRSSHQIDPESINGAFGTSGQLYINFPENLGTLPGTGISLGTNGISVYEHANDYMPAVLVYSATISNTLYSHVVVTYTNRQSRLYLNGNLVKTGLTSPYATVYLSGNSIGGGDYGRFNGLIGMVRYYNRPLSLEEVQKNFKAHRGRFNI